ncbi:unnamed protein product [Calypogeia fissa]
MSTPIPSLGNKTPEQLRVTELREELKKRGINIKGLKKDLVERLDEILRQEAAEAAAANEFKKSPGPEQVSDKEEETPALPAVVVEVPTQPEGEGDAADEAGDLNLGVVELEPNSEPLPGGDDVKTGIVEPTFSLPVPEEDGLSAEGKETEMGRSQVTFADPEIVSKDEPHFVEPVRTLTAESISFPKFDELRTVEPESAPAVEVMDEGNKAFDDDGKLEVEDTIDENLDSGKPVEADGIVEAATEANKFPEVEVQDQAVQVQSHDRSGPTSSTDAVIIEASEAEDVPTETAALSEGLRSIAYGERDAEEESVVAETADPMTTETITVETVSVVTETTVMTTETVVVNEIEADLSTADGEHEGSYTQRSSDAGTLSNEGKVAEEVVDGQNRDKDEGMEVEQDAKAKDSKPMEIDSDSLTGVKRKDGEELRHQEPAKRQRRWNSDKSIGASADVTASNVNTTDALKESAAPASRETQAPVAPSPSTTASSTPKASAASTSFDKPAPSRTVLSRTDIVNGDVDKKRVVPPPTRTPTVSLKIDRFVRPFTIKAVKELLEQTGTVKEMWMDQIKTHCFVTYSSVEEATATRNALYHLQWPVAGGKLLIAEFVEPEEVKSRVDGVNDKPVPTPVTTPRGSANSSTQAAGAMGITPPAAHISTSALPPPPPLPPPPRERPALPPKKEPEPPIPTLDDLFKKTRTKPQIYFLPLTDEQVADRQRNKQQVGKAPVKA